MIKITVLFAKNKKMAEEYGYGIFDVTVKAVPRVGDTIEIDRGVSSFDLTHPVTKFEFTRGKVDDVVFLTGNDSVSIYCLEQR